MSHLSDNNQTPPLSDPLPPSQPKKSAQSNRVIAIHPEGQRIQPKKASGRFANLRIVMIVLTQLFFYGMPWLNWGDRQAILFDIPTRHFYIFGFTLVPDDLIYLTGLLISSAFALFWWTTIAGRLWCGYTCPQTVYTEIMLWIDYLVEGDRNKRLKLDKEKWHAKKIAIKTIKYGLIFLVAGWTGISFAGWFVPIREFVPAIFTATATFAPVCTALFYGFVTWLFGHIMREKVCLYMCPYARFQSAMFDQDTLIISYDAKRGEPRGARKKNTDKTETHLGDCINCTMCVQVCPVGIDIRNGLQYQCIGCAACIDACDEIMDKMAYPRGLIRYTTEAVLQQQYRDQDIKRKLVRPKVLGYGAILITVIGAMLVGLSTRDLLKINIFKDRSAIVRENKQGLLENVYNLKITNASETDQVLQASVSGLDDIQLTGFPPQGLTIKGGEIITLPVQVATQPEYADKGSHPIQFHFHYHAPNTPNDKHAIVEEASFIGE